MNIVINLEHLLLIVGTLATLLFLRRTMFPSASKQFYEFFGFKPEYIHERRNQIEIVHRLHMRAERVEYLSRRVGRTRQDRLRYESRANQYTHAVELVMRYKPSFAEPLRQLHWSELLKLKQTLVVDATVATQLLSS